METVLGLFFAVADPEKAGNAVLGDDTGDALERAGRISGWIDQASARDLPDLWDDVENEFLDGSARTGAPSEATVLLAGNPDSWWGLGNRLTGVWKMVGVSLYLCLSDSVSLTLSLFFFSLCLTLNESQVESSLVVQNRRLCHDQNL